MKRSKKAVRHELANPHLELTVHSELAATDVASMLERHDDTAVSADDNTARFD